MTQAKKNVLGAVTPVMRQVTLILLREGAHSITAAGTVLRESRLEVNPGPFTVKRDLPVAFALAEEIRRRRQMRRERNTGLGLMVWYGYGRIHTQRQTLEHERLRDGRVRLAKRLERQIVHCVSDLRNPQRIGAWDGTVEGRFLLDASLFLEAGERRVWEARTARTGRGYQAVVENVWLSCYGKAVTVHASLHAALNAKPPVLQVEIERPLPDEDDSALSALAVA